MELRRPLAEIDAMGWADSVALLEGIYEARANERKFDALLHGKKLK